MCTMSKKYKYIRLENIENYEGWDLIHIIPRLDINHHQMCVICLDDGSQEEVESYIKIINNQQLEIDMLIRKKGYLQDEVCELQSEVKRLKEFEYMYNNLCE